MDFTGKLLVCVFATLSAAGAARASAGPWDVDVSDFPRLACETGDSARIQRAVAAAGKGGVVWFPRGTYEIDEMLVVSNTASLWLHKSAELKAVRKMPYVLRYFGRQQENGGAYGKELVRDHGLYIRGGDFNGNGLASCIQVAGLWHFTMSEMTVRNGKEAGIRLGQLGRPLKDFAACEINLFSIYCRCDMHGLAGNVGVDVQVGDAHITDVWVVDYTVGIRDSGWSNRFTRCHVWGGPVRDPKTGVSEMLVDSIGFDLNRDLDAYFVACYADTAKIGFNVNAYDEARLVGCNYYNNYNYKMDDPVVIKHVHGRLMVSECRFSRDSPHSKVYVRGKDAGELVWNDNILCRFTAEERAELDRELAKSGRVSSVSEVRSNLGGDGK